jgi:formylmethanofuran dehydrogenase subunit D
MAALSLTLITGRTRKQAHAMHQGKATDEYLQATGLVELNPADMARLGIADGDQVAVHSPEGRVSAVARQSDLPEGMAFIPMGPMANRLVGAGTDGTGMPSFKGLSVEVEKA